MKGFKVKSEKGITLTSLIIYIILIILIISLLSLVSKNFYNNLGAISESGKYISEFNKFNMYFIEDVKKNSEIYSIANDKIVFIDGTVYTFSEESIYRNQVKICKNVKSLYFSKRTEIDSNDFEKTIVTVSIIIKGKQPFHTQNDYVLKYW